MTRADNGNYLDDRYLATTGRYHMTGVQALVRLPLDIRRRDRDAGISSAIFISGYEGSPLGGYDLELASKRRMLDAHDVVFRPAVNEELAATAVQGTQLAATMPDRRVDGITGFWYGKSPGLDRASDALRHANLGGTHPLGGAVALVGDDTTAKSSTVPGASEHLLADLGIPTLYPSSPQEVLDLGAHAVAMSRFSGLWAALKIVTNVADGSGSVEVDPGRLPRSLADVGSDGSGHEVTAKLLGVDELRRLERSRNHSRLDRALRYAAANDLNRVLLRTASDRVGIVASGKVYSDLRQALRILGLDDTELTRRGIRLLKVGMIHPLEPSSVTEFARGLREVIVIEEKRAFLETSVRDLLYRWSDRPDISGKLTADGHALFPSDGGLTPDLVASLLAPQLMRHGDFPTVEEWTRRASSKRSHVTIPVVSRPPYFCSGCPHNSSTRVPDGTLVGGGIGCHTLALTMAPEAVGEIVGLTQMGGEGSQWIGIAPFIGRQHLVQNLGDGTFHHSGSLSIRAAVAAKVNITYKLLYNSAVAMTGGQQATGVMTVPQITRAMAAEGVERIIVTTDDPKAYRRSTLAPRTEVWHRDRLVEAQAALAATGGVTLLIHDQECAAELRRKRRRGLSAQPSTRVVINERVCEGCGDCGAKSNCLSVRPVATEFGRKTAIDQSSCNLDYSCLKGDCPSFITVQTGSARTRPRRPRPAGRKAIPAGSIPLPRPALAGHDGAYTIRILGVGGTGVVTLSQILSVAATLEGKHVACLDQTGLAQKGGSVVSDVRISDDPLDGANYAADGEADLYLGADLVVAADPSNLGVADPSRTVAVVSTTEVPTGPMITDPDARFPALSQLTDRVAASTRSDVSCYFDARRLSEDVLGDDQYANLLLAGAAWQLGTIPISAQAIEEAITLNGVRVEENLQAFRWGRQYVHDPQAVRAAWAGEAPDRPLRVPAQSAAIVAKISAPEGSPLRDILGVRVPDLINYQNADYARAYADFVERVRRIEAELVPGSTAVTEAVARNLHKLMAYKDEYEVARLSLDPQVRRSIAATFGPDARISYNLHPPLLRALGLQKKIAFGPWFRVVFRVLRSMRRVRGTWLDPFGHTRVRRSERGLVVEYRTTVESLAERLTADNAGLIARVADLPDLVRGYEEIKLRNIERYREEMSSLMSDPALAGAAQGGAE